jgi:hypothetical protein
MSQHPDEHRAEALDALLQELQTGNQRPSPLNDTSAVDATFVAALVQLSHEIEPDSGFAADLEERLVARSAVDTTGNGRRRPRQRTPLPAAPHGRSTTWRRWMSLAAMVLLALLLLTPPVRAAMGNVIRIGAVRIGLAPATTATPAPSPPYTGTVPTPLPSLLDLDGATTLDTARTQAGFPVQLPAYPPDLGAPQYVFLQNLNGTMVALVWIDPVHPSSVRLALFELSSDVYIYKSGATIITETTVHGQRALWTKGPYLVQVIENGQVTLATRVLVNGHALIWTEGAITYRLETSAPLDEAVKIAESLH